MPSGTVPPSRLGKICRVTIFVSIFLLVTDSRLRPAFLSKFSSDPKGDGDPSQKLVVGEDRSFVHKVAVASAEKPDSSILLRRIRRQAEEEETTEEPAEENEDQNGDGAVPSEENEEGEEAAEKPDKEEETETEEEEAEEEATTVRTRRTTLRTITTTKRTTTTPAPTTTDDDDEDATSTTNTSHSTSGPEVVTDIDCSVPAIRQFPPDAFSQRARQYGAIIVHLSVVVYMFICLAIVCDDYFCGSLEQVCKRLNLSEDVAGATLMAAGSSAPELFASLIGVFVAKGDVGTGTIVGSAVFNIMFVVGTCAFFAGNEGAQLSWWPIIRDTGFYWVSIAVLIGTLHDGYVTWYESLIMLMFYGLYVVAMLYNTRIYNFVVQKTGWTGPVQGIEETERLAGGGRFNKAVYSGYEQFANETDEVTMASQKPSAITLSADERIRRNPRKLTFANAALRIMMSPRYFYPRTRFIAAARFVIGENQVHAHEKRRGRIATTFSNAANHSVDSDYGTEARINELNRGKFRAARSFEVVSDEFEKWRIRPQPGAGYPAFARWILFYPIYFVLYYTIPDSKKERFAKWYLATFGISIAWIAVFSYIMVWMVTVVGHTLAIPDSIMGITFLAAGTSIPDAMASLIVARQGMVDMAVSNSIGSNVFDILIGLALPWFLSCAIIYPGTSVKINSNGLVFNAVLLFFSVVVANVGFRSQGWRLTKRLGMIFYATYGVYLLLAVMIEYNVFGYVNPPMCTDEQADIKEGLISATKAP